MLVSLQISSTCDLVLGLVDVLMDLRAARLSSPAQRVNPLFLDDMRAISNIALDLKEELQRAEHAFKEAGLRSVSSIVNANNSSRHGGSYSFERANISTSRRAAARKAANLFASSMQDVAHEECRNMDDIKDSSVADSAALPLPSITDTSDLPLPSITDTSLPLPSVTDSSHEARGESLELSQDL
ncbi:hypothetical protein CEUSTIGMA_g12086.t1 [Chlamydomonas eustigma]|uniref:Uncharacterized protein n=1 Tax=Chlamydomonas eustigma TaxID=1157962 RepID=A0A250XNJ6_9CHLO|nr:hypothetical protein CEUSTIGMA_g12086.t1 [Chlamydomonas eustigma]|eukprot:GAX84665.1 hypothetical protein CEUSTIGMA_g12086.t1 [Chlamydomonas eustigma]